MRGRPDNGGCTEAGVVRAPQFGCRRMGGDGIEPPTPCL
jgi:hypothetical protein